MSQPDEDWRHVKGFENRYLVSTEGRVWSVLTAQFLTPYRSDSDCPYLRVDLYGEDGKRKQPYVHTLVAYAFLGDPPNETAQVHHRDRNPENNVVTNIEWLTFEEHNGVHNGESEDESEDEIYSPKEAPF